MTIELTEFGKIVAAETPLVSQHIAVQWCPLPLRVWAEVHDGCQWSPMLVEAAVQAFREEVDIVQPWDVDFERHDGGPDECEDCVTMRYDSITQLGTHLGRSLQADGSYVDTGTGSADRWFGGPGEISYGTQDLFFVATVAGGDDWLSPLSQAVESGVRALFGAVVEEHLRFERGDGRM